MVDQFSLKPHIEPLVDFVNRLRNRYPNGYVPHFDENDGGVDAEILFLFEKPGPMTDPARGGSGFISQDNNDPTARAIKGFLQDAGIDRKKIAIWNTISAWNGTVKFTSEERRYALEEFAELLSIMKKVRCLVLVGREAQKIETKINLNKYQILRSYHPSPKVKSSMPDAWAGIPKIWREAISNQKTNRTPRAMEEVSGRDNKIISQALSIAIPLMLRYSLSSSNTNEMLRILKARGLERYPDRKIHEFLDTIIGDLRAGKTYELEKNKRDGIRKSHFEKEMQMYLEDIAPHLRS